MGTVLITGRAGQIGLTAGRFGHRGYPLGIVAHQTTLERVVLEEPFWTLRKGGREKAGLSLSREGTGGPLSLMVWAH